ncbi:DUF1194 domain-containing protein [Photobacterium galatheae]|uniref:VWFA domain-containing protein n=1 Tax=Photobacterium galatheae TaxID=1654360 RepID=A0A066RR41_9GAMM|nr:DUF1194 domain-containing protein [Photobacterium galatheae]KDM89853.1 hypothetical protein EA58_20600 [Photobacterium galatheae]MCM0151148.1 DUF1194 domain-containing protein [Photobacterium galatheae]
MSFSISIKKALLPVALTAALGTSMQANADVLELALLIDGSGSIGAPDFSNQISAYTNILNSAGFYNNFIVPSPYDQVYVSAWTFSGSAVQVVDWTLLDSDSAAATFASNLSTGASYAGGSTNTEDAIQDAVAAFSLAMQDYKFVIDISTDGVPTSSNSGGSATTAALNAADAARDLGVTINALGVGGVDQTFLEALVGINPSDTPLGFYLEASSFGSEFQDALIQKFGREVTDMPEPTSMALLGMGMLGLGLIRRRRNPTQTTAQAAIA